MKLETIRVKNFRLLKDVALSLESATTVIVGRNNSGKTSLTELFYKVLLYKVLTEKPRFVLEDFSLMACEDFWNAFALSKQGDDDDTIKDKLPVIEIELRFSYDKGAADLGVLGDFIVDLNPESTEVRVDIRYQVQDGKLGLLLNATGVIAEKEKASFFKLIKERIPEYYDISVEAVDPNDEENRKTLALSNLRELLQVNFINAQRPIDNERSRDGNALSKVLETIFNAKRTEQAPATDKDVINELNKAVAGVQDGIDAQFKDALKGLLPSLKEFGYPGLNDSVMGTETSLDVEKLLKDHTRLFYEGIEGVNLPEKHNGLGTRNLIYILFKLYEAFKQFQVLQKAPAAQLVFIEEPEAHLHPQMQEVFIRQINSIKEIFIRDHNDGQPWPVQFIVTTHSAHVANRANFRTIRYFLTSRKGGSQTLIKDLRDGLKNSGIEDDEKFLHKYLELTRCDLFFADKAILIEGQSERLLLPQMIDKVGKSLASQYVSTVEVGGAHAHIFFDFLKFLELKTLIITDIDTVGADGTKCCVSDGVATSNNCITGWFGTEESISPAQLLTKDGMAKTKGHLHIAYQIPENGTDVADCGRSFEEAFMRANPTLFTTADFYQEAKKVGKDKPDFALKYATGEEEWTVPKYIKDGIEWLAKNPSGQVISEVIVPDVEVPDESSDDAGQ